MKQQVNRVRLTAGRVADFTCPIDKPQAFLWDTDTPTLALRATPTGRKTYVFESRLNGATIRINIGTLADWPIEKARTKAQGLKMLVDGGTDPREVERDRLADKAAAIAATAAQVEADKVEAVTVGEVWAVYLEARKTKWGERHYTEHVLMVNPGGIKTMRGTRGRGVNAPGILHALMAMPLRDLTPPVIEVWADNEAKTRPSAARLAWRCLKAFLSWCAEQPDRVA